MMRTKFSLIPTSASPVTVARHGIPLAVQWHSADQAVAGNRTSATNHVVDRSELEELCCIQPIQNLRSIAVRGILSHNAAADVPHVDISMEEVQDLRSGKRVPDARLPQAQWRWLHDYANLYFCARNPMLFKRLSRHRELAVVRIRPDALDLPAVVVTDGNAASNATRFGASAEGLARIDKTVTYARYWTHNDPYAHAEHKRRMCAEVLVPECLPPEYIAGAYVSCDDSAAAHAAEGLPWTAEIKRYVFFS
jgi:hypothetical protein